MTMLVFEYRENKQWKDAVRVQRAGLNLILLLKIKQQILAK